MKKKLLPYAFILAILIYGRFCHQQLYFSSVEAKPDQRAVKLSDYLYAKGSTMAQEASFIVKTSDYYHLNYKLIPAIAGVESNFEKSGNTTDNNPFGIMCSGKPCYFNSMEEVISYEARLISNGRAYATFQSTGRIIDLAKVYTENPPDWTAKVLYFENQIDKWTK